MASKSFMAESKDGISNMGTRGRDEDCILGTILNFWEENFVRGVDCETPEKLLFLLSYEKLFYCN